MTHEIKSRPILMNGAMVRATLSGAKTQTRRLCKNNVYGNGTWNTMAQDFLCHNDYLPPSAMLMEYKDGGNTYITSDMEGWDFCCPHGQPGDRLWVRESFNPWRFPGTGNVQIEYAADGEKTACAVPLGRPYKLPDDDEPLEGDQNPMRFIRGKGRPSIHMPRWASRITLEITGVRVERLHDISTEDIIAEGLSTTLRGYDAECDLRDQWRKLWESTGGDWDSNPWLWVINFAKAKA